MNPLHLLPTTMAGVSAWAMGIAILLLFIFKDKSKPAAWLGVIGGIGVSGWIGTLVTKMVGAGATASARITTALLGSSVVALFFIGLFLWVWQKAGKGGKGVRGKFKPWFLLLAAATVGAVIGTIPMVYDTVNTAITTATTTVRSMFG